MDAYNKDPSPLGRRRPRASTGLGRFFPLFIGFTAGCMIWTLLEVLPSLPGGRFEEDRADVHPLNTSSVELETDTGTSKATLPPPPRDEPFRGRIGEGLSGGGANWRSKLPAELEKNIPNHKDLPHLVIRKAHNVVQEISTKRVWERVGGEWIELDPDDEASQEQAALETKATASKSFTLSLKEQEAQERKQRERREAKLRQESLEKERNKLEKERARLRDSRMEAEERDIMKKKKVSTKLQVMCKTAVPGGTLYKSCIGWGFLQKGYAATTDMDSSNRAQQNTEEDEEDEEDEAAETEDSEQQSSVVTANTII